MSENNRCGTKHMKPTIVKKWDVKDRGDGMEIRMRFDDGRTEKVNWRDSDAVELAETIQKIAETDDEDRPVRGEPNVR